jgi:hypothetical protein
MSRLSEILDSGLFVDSDGQPDYRTGSVRQQIIDLFLEVIGEDYTTTTYGHDERALKIANQVKAQLRQKVREL